MTTDNELFSEWVASQRWKVRIVESHTDLSDTAKLAYMLSSIKPYFYYAQEAYEKADRSATATVSPVAQAMGPTYGGDGGGASGYDSSKGRDLAGSVIIKTGKATEGKVEKHQQVPESEMIFGSAPDTAKPPIVTCHVEGKTIAFAQYLKAQRGTWDPNRKVWVFRKKGDEFESFCKEMEKRGLKVVTEDVS